MIDKVNNNQYREIIEQCSVKHPNGAAPRRNNGLDALLQADYASLIEKAGQAQVEDEAAVERARALLMSGQLESIQNIRAAAENIVLFGV